MSGVYGEPWSEGPNDGRIFDCEDRLILDNEGYYEADMSRIVACVNPLEGIEDPAAFLSEMRDQMAELMTKVAELCAQRDELLASAKAVRVRFRQEFAALTDGQYGTADAFSEMQALSVAIAKAEGGE